MTFSRSVLDLLVQQPFSSSRDDRGYLQSHLGKVDTSLRPAPLKRTLVYTPR